MMSQATGLVRQGQVNEAMAMIKARMGVVAAPQHAYTESGDLVIDIEAREVDQNPEPGAVHNQADGQFPAGSYTGKSGTRAYKLFIPPTHQDGSLRPLVVMLHGCTQDPDDFAAGTGMNEAARDQGFFVLYPAQTQHANSSRCWNWFKHNHQKRGRGEPEILAGMTQQIIEQHRIDSKRVYVAGLSAGGAMAAVLGEVYPELFAAVGVHSGLPVGAASDVSSAFGAMKGGGVAQPSSAHTPTIVFHGDRDATVHPINGERVASAAHLHLDAKTTVVRGVQGRSYTRHVHVDLEGHTVAEHWLVHGAGHAWSGGSTQGSYADPQGPSATKEMLRFFSGQRLN